MPDEINNLDPEDIGLKGIFGDRFHDETARAPEKPENIQTNSKYYHTRKSGAGESW